ncbi:hypothetical protein AA637_14830 [Cyanobacterium sp. HL-69]|uniref:tetratricopeptide repeat protein n=1 Tax=Cyanobacterium sp. HL-69 TaxID=2054282 RepID=UPI000CA11116|nr:hypothetical protein AA637_14830 [Cyanobacterium sp. HL-69]
MKKFAIALIKSKLHHKCLLETQEAIHYTLQDMGFDSILTDNLAQCDRQYIILGVNNLLYPNQIELPPNSIIYNLEQIYPQSPWIQSGYLDYLYQYPIWDYSLSNIAQLRKWGINKVQHLPIGYHPCLTNIPQNDNQDIDVLFYGSINERRQKIIDSLEAKGIKVKALFGVYGKERNRYISRSKIVLNMHFYEAQVFEIVRVSHLLANQIFVISERSSNSEEEKYFQGGLVFCPYENLVSTCLDYLSRDKEREIISKNGYHLFKDCSLKEYLNPLINSISHNNNHQFIKDFYRKNQAKNAFHQGNYQGAIALYEQSLQIDPDCLESNVYLALGFLYNGDDLTAELILYSFIDDKEQNEYELHLLQEKLIQILRQELNKHLQSNNQKLVDKIKVYINSLLF